MSKTHILPLSLEDNSTVAGTASILDDFADEFSLPSANDNIQLIPLDESKGSFDINLARSRVEYLKSKYRRQSYMAQLENDLRSREKALEGRMQEELEESEETDNEERDSIEKDSIHVLWTMKSDGFEKRMKLFGICTIH